MATTSVTTTAMTTTATPGAPVMPAASAASATVVSATATAVPSIEANVNIRGPVYIGIVIGNHFGSNVGIRIKIIVAGVPSVKVNPNANATTVVTAPAYSNSNSYIECFNHVAARDHEHRQ
jgi:hypothetical protein